MKKILFVAIFAAAQALAFAQTGTSFLTTDSIRVVELREVTVNKQQASNQQKLVNFFRSNHAATLEDIMSRLPELSLLRRGAYGMEPSIRSFTGGQINVLVDGMRIHGACTDKMDPATIYIEPINLENLQVQTANTGFINGSSIGGSINMKMAEPDYLHNNQLTGTISSGYQSAAKSLYESIRLNYSAGKWAFRASGSYRNHQNYRSGGGATIPFSQYEKVNYSFSAKFQQSQYTYLKADVLADDGWNIGYAALPMDLGYAAARIASLSINNENRQHHLYKWQAKIFANTVRHFMDDTHRPLVAMHMDMPGESKTMGMYAEGELKINHKQKLLLRTDASATFLKASMTMYQPGELPMYMLTWPDNRKGQYGVAATWLLQVDSTLKVQVSSRADYITCNLVSKEAKNQLSVFGYLSADRKALLKNFSAQASKKITGKFSATASIGYAERMPTASELYGFYLFNSSDGYDYIGNPLLKTERSVQADLSLTYSNKQSSIRISGYYARIADYITGLVNPSISTMTIGANGVKSFVNTARATIMGLEASAAVKASTALDIVSTIRYSIGNNQNKLPLPAIAPLKNINTIRYHGKQFFIQLESESALRQNRFSTQAGEDMTGGYFLLHTRIGYNTTLLNTPLELQAGVENIADTKYHEHLDWGNIARQGRNVYLQAKISF